MAKGLETIDRRRTEPTASEARQVEACKVLNEPAMTFLRARKVAGRIQEPEQVIRHYRAALEAGEDATASAFLYRLCRLLDAEPDLLVREFGGAFLLEDWMEEEKYLVGMIMERTPCPHPANRWEERNQGSLGNDLRDGSAGRKVDLEEVIGILEDLALRYAEKAGSENSVGNPRGMRQDLWKSKGIVEAADLLRRMFRS